MLITMDLIVYRNILQGYKRMLPQICMFHNDQASVSKLFKLNAGHQYFMSSWKYKMSWKCSFFCILYERKKGKGLM